MVSAIKKWLGIDALERENLTLARAVAAHSRRIDILEGDAKETLALIEQYRKELTPEPAKPKIVATKPKPVNWKNFRTAAEKASESEREEA